MFTYKNHQSLSKFFNLEQRAAVLRQEKVCMSTQTLM